MKWNIGRKWVNMKKSKFKRITKIEHLIIDSN